MNCLTFYKLTQITNTDIVIITSIYKQSQHDTLFLGQIEFV